MLIGSRVLKSVFTLVLLSLSHAHCDRRDQDTLSAVLAAGQRNRGGFMEVEKARQERINESIKTETLCADSIPKKEAERRTIPVSQVLDAIEVEKQKLRIIPESDSRARDAVFENIKRLETESETFTEDDRTNAKDLGDAIKGLKSRRSAAIRYLRRGTENSLSALFGKSLMLGFVDADQYEAMMANDVIYEAQDGDSQAKPFLVNGASAIILNSGVALRKSVQNIVTKVVGTSLERGAGSISKGVGFILKKIWVNGVKFVLWVDGEPLEYQKVDDFGQFICGMVKDFQKICKTAGKLNNREMLDRAKAIEAPEALEKLVAIVSAVSGVSVNKKTAFSELKLSPEGWANILDKVVAEFEVELFPEDLEKIFTLEDLVTFIQIDEDWREERENRLNEIAAVMAYFDYCLGYYVKDHGSSMEKRYGSMVQNGLKELVSVISKAKSDKDFGMDNVQRRLKRLNSSLERNFRNLLRYLPNYSSEPKADKVETSSPKSRRDFRESDLLSEGF